LKLETENLEKETLESTRRALRDLYGAQDAGNEILNNLAVQNEKIDNIVANLDLMRSDIAYANVVLDKIASPFNFVNLKTARVVFETAFGQPSEWSGFLKKASSGILSVYSEYFFVIAGKKLLQFSKRKDTEIHKLDFGNPKASYSLHKAIIHSSDRKTKVILLGTLEGKMKLKCKDDNDFVGWLTMLERVIEGKKKTINDEQPQQQFGSYLPASVKQYVAPTSEANNGLSVDDQVNNNLDEMVNVLDNLGAMAFETKQAIEIQNQKLDIVEENIEITNEAIRDTQGKHRKRLK
jgi:hypothetical protein